MNRSHLSKHICLLFAFLFLIYSPTYGQEEMADQRSTENYFTNEPLLISTRSTQGTSTQTTKTDDQFVFPTRKQRARRYANSAVGPFALFRVAASAGIKQWKDSPEEWEQGMSGYGRRFASDFGRNAIQQTVVYGLDSALGWDTGFRRSGKKEFGARFVHALAENITSRTKSGKRVISVPRIAGAYSSGVIATETWYPERYNYKDGLRMGTNTILTGFVLNLVREFLVKF